MVKDLADVFSENLREMYYVEEFLVDALEKLKTGVNSTRAREDFIAHREETIEHVKRLEEIFTLTGIKKTHKRSEIWKQMGQELDTFLKSGVSAEAADFFILESAAKAERLEISHYETLILVLKELEADHKNEILNLLRKNLIEEEAALDKVIAEMKKHVSFWKRNIH